MPYITITTRIADDQAQLKREHKPDMDGLDKGPSPLFYRAPGEPIRSPSDVVALLKTAGFEIGTRRPRNPITHDQW